MAALGAAAVLAAGCDKIQSHARSLFVAQTAGIAAPAEIHPASGPLDAGTPGDAGTETPGGRVK